VTLQKIQGHTYYFPAPTNVGVIRNKSGMVLMVDVGIDSTAGRAAVEAIEAEGLKPKYVIVTHYHPDHSGALKWLKDHYPGVESYASGPDALMMANPYLNAEILYGAAPLRQLESRYLKGPAVNVDRSVEAGPLEIGDKKYQIIELPGHADGQIGILTSDAVLFIGDALFSEETMAKYGFPYLIDIGKQLETIDTLAQMDAEYVVLAHASKVYPSIAELCKLNKERIEYFCEQILEWCNQPLTREDIAEKIIQMTGMEVDIRQYHLTLSTTGAFLSYLANRQDLSFEVIAGKCYFFRE